MTLRAWKKTDPLFRGDAAAGPSIPDPGAGISVVAHILYLGGPGRRTQFTSTTEDIEVAEYFAGHRGRVWETTVRASAHEGALHLPHEQLLENLTGHGKGSARWPDPWEVAQAANYVKQWSEHLMDWHRVAPVAIGEAIGRSFKRRS